jgi:hypothetical protein
MNNITYSIIENEDGSNCSSNGNNNWEEISLTNKKSKIDITSSIIMMDAGERCARELDYDLNYNVKYLTHILEFYGMKKGKLNKKEIIERLLEFEFDTINNLPIVEERKRLFDNFIELKNDKFFSKFILGSF